MQDSPCLVSNHKDVAEEVPAASKTLAPLESDVSKSMVEWRKDKAEFDCKVDESLRVRVFCCQSKSWVSTVNPLRLYSLKGGLRTSPSGSSNQRKEDFLLGEAIVNLRLDPFEARRTKEFRWHNLSGGYGWPGYPTYAGQVSFLTETIDLTPLEPQAATKIADAECRRFTTKKDRKCKGTTTQENGHRHWPKDRKTDKFQRCCGTRHRKIRRKSGEKPSFDPFFQKRRNFRISLCPSTRVYLTLTTSPLPELLRDLKINSPQR